MYKGEPYVHQIRGADNLIGPPFEILSDKAVKYYEKLKDKGENVYIDSLTYEKFMVLGDAELSRRFSMQDEAEQKAKIDREQANELEYVDESQKSDAAESANASNGSAGAKPVRNPEREKPKREDTITNRMLHWLYTSEQFTVNYIVFMVAAPLLFTARTAVMNGLILSSMLLYIGLAFFAQHNPILSKNLADVILYGVVKLSHRKYIS